MAQLSSALGSFEENTATKGKKNMPGGILSSPERLIAACFVAVGGGVATLVTSLGGVRSVSRTSAGLYVVTLKGPPLPFASGHGPIIIATGISAAFSNVVATLASGLTVGVSVFDAAGVAADGSFSLLLLSTEREGGAA
jgi:hypothetical protein